MSAPGRSYWRSLEELADSAEFAAAGERLMAAYHIHPETLSECGVCHR